MNVGHDEDRRETSGVYKHAKKIEDEGSEEVEPYSHLHIKIHT
jgi:hypothetical protein